MTMAVKAVKAVTAAMGEPAATLCIEDPFQFLIRPSAALPLP